MKKKNIQTPQECGIPFSRQQDMKCWKTKMGHKE